jgi:hypothetical protein
MVRKSGRSEESWVSEMLEQAQSAAGDYPQMQESVRRRTSTNLDSELTVNFVFGLDALLDGLEARVKK